MITESDIDLIEGLRKRHPKAQQTTLDRFGHDVFAQVVRLIPVVENAEEVYQDVFIKVFDNIQRYDPNRSSLKTWISRIAYNEAISFLRKKSAGSMFILWLGERITDKGIGNGVSLIIMIGIIARLPMAFYQEVASRFAAITGGGLVMFIIEIIILYAVVCAAIVLVQGVRKIPVQYAKRVVGNKQYGGARQYIPLKLFAANVMPIIFAQALMFIPLAIAQYANPQDASWFMRSMTDHQSWLYNVIFAVLIIAFTYFYTAITLNPTQMAEDMKRNNGFIPGVKPGKDTAEYIDTVMSRITLPGSLFIAFIAIMPAFAGLLDVKQEFAQFFGGTSLLILVGVVLDTLQQIESHLLMRHYDGLLNSGRIHGRGGVAAY